MCATNERLQRGSDRLKQTHEVTLEMENTANSILGDLSKQRETLLHSQGTLRVAGEGLESSRRVLRQMARRAAANKLMMWGVIAFIILLIVLLLWLEGGDSAADAATTAYSSDPDVVRVADGGDRWQKVGSSNGR